jgi:hypothetical protein
MKTIISKKSGLRSLVTVLFSLTLVAGCSDDKPQDSKTPEVSGSGLSQAKNDAISRDSPQDPTPEAEDDQKKQFQHDFAAQCVERELNNSQNQSSDADKITKACDCIAKYVTQDLTDEEAKKFLADHDNPQSLRIKYEAGAYECLQEKTKLAEPKLFGKPESAE